MWKWLEKLRAEPPAPLTGAPPVRRQKSYSAASGYVYQYYYEGQRPARREREAGTEFVFDVSADRKTSFAVSVFLPDSALEAWARAHERPVQSNERYALAKMGLVQAFDERANPQLMRQEVRLRAADVAAILERLGIE